MKWRSKVPATVTPDGRRIVDPKAYLRECMEVAVARALIVGHFNGSMGVPNDASPADIIASVESELDDKAR